LAKSPSFKGFIFERSFPPGDFGPQLRLLFFLFASI
jgi:hypothetical protein